MVWIPESASGINANVYGVERAEPRNTPFTKKSTCSIINALITAGIAVSKKEKYKNYVQYKPTGRLLKLWWAKQKAMKKKAIAEKIAEKTHTSAKYALKNTLPYLQVAFKKNKNFRNGLVQELDLSEEEIEWLMK